MKLPKFFINRTAVVLSLMIGIFSVGIQGQNALAPANGTVDNQEENVKPGPVYTNYKEIRIGTTADEVRNQLGKAKIDDKDGFYYKISNDEFVQIRVNKAKKVRLVAVTYRKIEDETPSLTDVFGPDAEAKPKKDGSLYKFVRYPAAGYWIAYTRTAGDKPMVTVTMQQIF